MKLNLFFLSVVLLCTSLIFSQNTYTVGKTEYYSNQTYSTTGLPKVKRSEANKTEYLRSKGYSETPKGYEIDHIIPLSQGGSDSPYNMQLLTEQQHKAKTARESANRTNVYNNSSYNSNATYTRNPSTSSFSTPTYSLPKTSSTNYNNNSSSTRVMQTGSRGGTYYINSNGNKTYVKK